MIRKFKTLALAAIVSVGAFAAVPSTASAGNVDIDIHFGQGFGFGYGPGWGGGYGPYKPHCMPGKALYKAKSMGLKKAYVHKANWNGVVIKGKKFGQTKVVGFGKHPSCPVKYWQ